MHLNLLLTVEYWGENVTRTNLTNPMPYSALVYNNNNSNNNYYNNNNNRTKMCVINPNILSANQDTGFSKSVKMNHIGQHKSHHERLGSEKP